jgi:hypothetical protein
VAMMHQVAAPDAGARISIAATQTASTMFW